MPRPAARARRRCGCRCAKGRALVVREVPLEEYVAATALSEVHPDVADEAVAERMFEVQAVIARTYAVVEPRPPRARTASTSARPRTASSTSPRGCRRRAGRGGARRPCRARPASCCGSPTAPARAVFHADCGGHTSDAAAVWGGSRAGLSHAARRDDGPAGSRTPSGRSTRRAAALRRALNADPRTAVGASLDRIDVAGRDAAGRAEKITLRGTRTFVVRGEVFREVVTRALGAKSIRSTLFTVKKTRDAVRVFGQGLRPRRRPLPGRRARAASARARASDGVLAHYFPGTTSCSDRDPVDR